MEENNNAILVVHTYVFYCIRCQSVVNVNITPVCFIKSEARLPLCSRKNTTIGIQLEMRSYQQNIIEGLVNIVTSNLSKYFMFPHSPSILSYKTVIVRYG